MEITNNGKATQGVQTTSGPAYIKIGETKTVELTEVGLRLAKRLPFLTLADPAGGGSEGSGADGSGGDEKPPVASYAVKDKGRGWFAITDGNTEVTKSLRADDVEGFDSMSDADKAAFVQAHKSE